MMKGAEDIGDSRAARRLRFLLRSDQQLTTAWDGDASVYRTAEEAQSLIAHAALDAARGEKYLAAPLLRSATLLRGHGVPAVEAIMDMGEQRRAMALGLGGHCLHQTGCGRSAVRLDRLRSYPVGYLWPNRFPLREVSLLVGAPGEGKSTLAMLMAATVTSGNPWPDGADNVRGHVLFVAGEDSAETTILPRFKAAGGRVRRAMISSLSIAPPDRGPSALRRHLLTLEEEVKGFAPVRLIVIDPVTCFGGIDANSTQMARELMMGLKRIAEQYALSVIAISHPNKQVHSRAAFRTVGNIAFPAVPRAVYFVGDDPRCPGRRLLVPDKFSLGLKPPAVAFQIVPSTRNPAVGVVRFDDWNVVINADQMLQGSNGKLAPPRAGKSEQAVAFLKAQLAGGPRRQKDIATAADEQDIAPSTLRRAKVELNVETQHLPPDRTVWWWALPRAPTTTCSP